MFSKFFLLISIACSTGHVCASCSGSDMGDGMIAARSPRPSVELSIREGATSPHGGIHQEFRFAGFGPSFSADYLRGVGVAAILLETIKADAIIQMNRIARETYGAVCEKITTREYDRIPEIVLKMLDTSEWTVLVEESISDAIVAKNLEDSRFLFAVTMYYSDKYDRSSVSFLRLQEKLRRLRVAIDQTTGAKDVITSIHTEDAATFASNMDWL